MNKRLIKALEFANEWAATGGWVVIKVTDTDVYLDYGCIWSNGERERPIVSRRYHPDGTYTKHVHT